MMQRRISPFAGPFLSFMVSKVEEQINRRHLPHHYEADSHGNSVECSVGERPVEEGHEEEPSSREAH
jgi:hypothetical protein